MKRLDIEIGGASHTDEITLMLSGLEKNRGDSISIPELYKFLFVL